MKKINRFFLFLSLVVSLIYGLACSKVEFKTATSSEPNNHLQHIDDPPQDDPPSDKTQCHTDHFTQSRVTNSGKLDILFITDTSASLDVERQMIATQLDHFIGQLPSGMDYQVAVTLAHGDNSSHSGNLYQAGTESTVLRSTELSVAQIQEGLAYKLTHTAGDNETDGGEAGLYSLYKELQPDRLATIRAEQNFFRQDAGLAIIFVSDENDICAIYPNGVTPVYDPDGKEVPAKAKYCAAVNASVVYQRLAQVQAGRPLIVSSIIYTPSGVVPVDGENEIGYGYLETALLNGGPLVDIGLADYSVSLQAVGEATNTVLNWLLDYQLSLQVSNLVSVKVSAGGVDLPFIFNPATQSVHLYNHAALAADISVKYCYSVEQ